MDKHSPWLQWIQIMLISEDSKGQGSYNKWFIACNMTFYTLKTAKWRIQCVPKLWHKLLSTEDNKCTYCQWNRGCLLCFSMLELSVQKLKFAKLFFFFKINKGYLKDHWTNTRLVCSYYFNVFFCWICMAMNTSILHYLNNLTCLQSSPTYRRNPVTTKCNC